MFVAERVYVTETFQPDPDAKAHVDNCEAELEKKLDKVGCICTVPLDARFSRVRTEETVIGNWISDITRIYMATDIALLNGGGLRANRVHEPGPIKLKFLAELMPLNDKIVQVNVPGRLLIGLIENSLSLYPKYEGRFPVVSGLQFEFDPEKPPGSRVIEDSFRDVYDELIDPDKIYSVATPFFLAEGKDGFGNFKDP